MNHRKRSFERPGASAVHAGSIRISARDARAQIDRCAPIGRVVNQREDAIDSPWRSARDHADVNRQCAGAFESSSHCAAHTVGADRGLRESDQDPSGA
jgi:hypothetical protein